MRFWDASALIPLLVQEASTESLARIYLEDRSITVWWSSAVECASSIARLERQGLMPGAEALNAAQRLQTLRTIWKEISPSDLMRDQAMRLLRLHPLRAGDALQLAAAWVASEQRPVSMEFVCLDQRLAKAALLEGFKIIAS